MTRLSAAIARALACSAIVVSSFASATSWQFTTLQAPNGLSTAVGDVNNRGQVAGVATGSTDSQGFVYQGGAFNWIAGPSGALGTTAWGLSDNGVVVGNYYFDHVVDQDSGQIFQGPQHGMIYDGKTYTTLDVPGSTDTVLRGVSPDGRYVSGYYNVEDGTTAGFVYDRGTGTIAYVPQSPIGSSVQMIVQGINSSGQAVGSDIVFGTSGGSLKGGFWYDVATGVRTDSVFSSSNRESFRDIDTNGRIAGWVQTPTLPGQPTSLHGLVGTPGAFESVSFQDYNVTLQGINDAGWISGNASDATGEITYAFIGVPVPEPASAALLLVGGLFLALRRRR